jgi:hypothetical protein
MERYEPPKRKYFKNVNFVKIFIRALMISCFIAISFTCSYLHDEGQLGTSWITNFFADIFVVFQFPMLFIFVRIHFYTWETYYSGLLINALLFSIVIQMIFFLLGKIWVTKSAFILRPIGFIIEIIGIIIIIISEEVNFSKTLHNAAGVAYTDPGDKSIYLFTGLGVLVFGWILFAFSLNKREKKDISIK